jgi:hypothetical protein
MRNFIPITFVAATVLVGCRTSVVPKPAAAPTPFQPLLVTTPGTSNYSADGTWRIFVSTTSGPVEVSQSGPSKDWGETLGIFQTQLRPGWFVYAENETRLWAYDGDRDLTMFVLTPGRTGIYGVPFAGVPVPPEIFWRLRETMKERITTNFHPMFITTPGTTNYSPTGAWRIIVSGTGGPVNMAHARPRSPTEEMRDFTGWGENIGMMQTTARLGWFVYFESESRVWAYDGDLGLTLLVWSEGRPAIYAVPFPDPVPVEVYWRLRESMKERLDANKRN